MGLFGAILLNNVSNLISIYIEVRYRFISSRDKIRQATTIIMNFALFGEIIIKNFSLLLVIRNLSIIVKNGRDICKLLLISIVISLMTMLLVILLSAVQKCFYPL